MHKHGMVSHLPTISKMKEPCKACMLGNQQRKVFPQESINRSGAPLELVHVDLCGKMTTRAFWGSSHFIFIVNDYRTKIWVFLRHH